MTDKDFSFDNTSQNKDTNENNMSRYGENERDSREENHGFSEKEDNLRNNQDIRGERDIRGSYPYGNNNSHYPYGRNNSPEYGNHGFYVKKKTLSIRLKEFFYDKKVLGLTVLGTVTGCAILLYHLFAFIMSTLVSESPVLNSMYFSDELFKNFFGMLYSVICVALPFAAAYIVLRKAGMVSLALEAPKKGSGLPLLILGGLGFFYIGNVLTTIVITTLSGMGIELYSYTDTLAAGTPVPENIFMFLVMSVHSAVIPAVVEEFAFRGVVMQPLRKYGDWFAIISSAVLFGLLHGNMMQMPFAVIAGIVLGYVTVVTGSMWTGIILHFLNNFLSLVYSILGELLSDSVRVAFSALYTYGIIVIGLVAFAGFAFYNPDFYRLYPSKVPSLNTKRAAGVYFLIPPMLVALGFMTVSVLRDFYFA